MQASHELDMAWTLLRDMERELAAALDDEIVGLCRARLAMLLDPAGAGSDPDAETVPERSTQLAHWPTSPAFTEGERAHLALAEQLVIDGSGVDDALVGALAAHHSAREIYTFVRWVQASEARARARLVLRHHSESGRFR